MNRSSLYQVALGAILYFPLSASLGCEGQGFDNGEASGVGAASAASGVGGAVGAGGVSGVASTSMGVGGGGVSGTGGSAVGAGGMGGSGGVASPCAPGFELCNDVCIDPLTDGNHCGGCALPACGTGQTCVGGVCQCQSGLTDCLGTCANTASDRSNCGVCGTVCSPELFCSAGRCEATCGQGLTQCPGGACADLTSDLFNCGTCGMQCMGGRQCMGSECVCPNGTCPDGSCNAGSCSCPGGQTYCPSSNTCVSTQTDSNNCGTCGVQCMGGRQCMGSECVCPNGTCPDGSCNAGSCSCPGGQTYCPSSNTCANTQTDSSNCGSCGRACAQGETCTSGNCGGGTCSQDNTTYSGRMTFYDLGGSTPACHFPPNGLPQYYGAMNEQDYAASAVCGACVEIRNTENNSTLTVQIVDECPCEEPNLEWCCNAQANHHIDVNQASYSALGANNNPPISWRYVPCSTSGNIRYYFDPAAKEGYLAVTIMNHRYRIKRVTANGQQLTRRDYNVWESTSHGPGPFTFQVTDIYDRTITDSNVPLSAGQMVQSSAQFATCQ